MAVIQSPFNSRRPNHTKQCIALQCTSHLDSHQACSQEYSDSVAQQLSDRLLSCCATLLECCLQLYAYRPPTCSGVHNEAGTLPASACGVMSYQVWSSVYAYFISLHPSCSSKLIVIFTKLRPQVLNCLQVCLLFK